MKIDSHGAHSIQHGPIIKFKVSMGRGQTIDCVYGLSMEAVSTKSFGPIWLLGTGFRILVAPQVAFNSLAACACAFRMTVYFNRLELALRSLHYTLTHGK